MYGEEGGIGGERERGCMWGEGGMVEGEGYEGERRKTEGCCEKKGEVPEKGHDLSE